MPSSKWLPGIFKPRRHLVLFVGAVVIPCGALIVTGLRMLSQDRELADKRAADERHRVASSAGQVLVAKLTILQSREAEALGTSRRAGSEGYADSATVLVAHINRGKVEPPWSAEDWPAPSGGFEAMIAVGQRFASEPRQSLRAAAVFDSAAHRAPDERRRAWAQLLAAGAMASGDSPDADARLSAVALMPFRLRDEYGVPFALYAKHRLVSDSADPAFVRRIEHDLMPARDLSPTACSLASSFMRAVSAMHRRCVDLENAAEVVDTWQPSSRASDSVWTVDRSRSLLYSANASVLTIVRVDRVVASLAPFAPPTRVAAASDSGDLLSPLVPGLRAIPLPATLAMERGQSTRDVYLAGLALILVTGLSVAFLLWRDTQREIRLAATRAQFVAGVSHELKTPLTAIRMYAETLRAGRPRDPAARDEYLDTIVAESERLSRLLDNVLDFAKIERGTKNYALRPQSLANVVDDAQRIMAHALTQQGFELDTQVDRDLPLVALDADAVQQAVLNLMVNAVKYSGESRRIALRVAREGTWAVVTVVDFGVGIAAADRERIFEQFYRAPGPQNTSVPGAGLGLTIVSHIAAAHHGKVVVDSEPGHGSAFSLFLPMPAPIADSRPTQGVLPNTAELAR